MAPRTQVQFCTSGRDAHICGGWYSERPPHQVEGSRKWRPIVNGPTGTTVVESTRSANDQSNPSVTSITDLDSVKSIHSIRFSQFDSVNSIQSNRFRKIDNTQINSHRVHRSSNRSFTIKSIRQIDSQIDLSNGSVKSISRIDQLNRSIKSSQTDQISQIVQSNMSIQSITSSQIDPSDTYCFVRLPARCVVVVRIIMYFI